MIVTRFPPSPTGFLHVGGLRTALYNFLFAKQKGGRFILRIEDTDQKRYVEGAVENLLRTLAWAGITYDEGPYFEGNMLKEKGSHGPYVQSKRINLYQKYADLLLEQGHAYQCFCTAERLKTMREEHMAKKLPPKYDRHCLSLSKKETDALIARETPFVIRQKIPDGTSVTFTDLIRGNVIFQSKDLDDQVLLKSDGFPTYHLANVIDDHSMEVSHVIRGEEWLSSTPKHILLSKAFGWNTPQFGHLPLLLDKQRQKLSKRMGHVAVEDYMKEGYLPEAVLNFVALLGWNPGGTDQEIFSLEELEKIFSFEKVHKGGAIFDVEKLHWMNWQWRKRKYEASLPPAPVSTSTAPSDTSAAPFAIHEKTMNAQEKTQEMWINARMEALEKLVKEYLPELWKKFHGKDREKFHRALITVEEKILQDPKKIQEYIQFFFAPSLTLNLKLLCNPKMKVDQETAKKALRHTREKLSAWNDFSNDQALQKPLNDAVEQSGFKRGQIFWPVRVALTNEPFTPGVFEVIWVLGKEETLQKLDHAVESLR